jgi:cysteine synthase A
MEALTKTKLHALAKKIGNTSVVDFGDGIFGKIEGENPAGSVKDRAAYYIVLRALESGELKENGTVAEATSGNTGIGLAYIARELGLKAVMVMPESMSVERRSMLKAYGAELVLTPAELGMGGSVAEAERIKAQTGAFLANQFGNYAGVEAHFLTTAPEMFKQIENLRYVVAGVGSGGTAMGFAKYIRENGLDCKVVAVEPASSPLLSKGYAGAHKIQGIGANFVPELVHKDRLDIIVSVSDEDAYSGVREIYRSKGLKCGISSGAAFSAAKRLRESVEGSIGVILPDNGDRYPQSLYI